MHPQLPGVLMMAIMGIFHTPKNATVPPPSAVENLSFLLEHASEVVLNSTEMASLSNYTVGLINATELTPLVRGSLLNDLTANAVVDGNYTAPFHLTAKYVPLWNASHVGKTWSTQHFDRRLVGPIEVGTPGVEYKMHFDNGRWKDSVLFADPVNFHEIKLYNFAKDSSTHTSITYTKKVVNGSGTFEQTDKREDISDVFRISKAHSIRQNFVVMDSVKENEKIAALFKVLPADGILSLSSAPKSTGSFPSFLNASLADMRDQVVTFHVERVSNFTEKEQSASLSFGDLDPVHCNKDNWTVVPQLNLNNWAFHMGALKFTFGGLLANNTVLQVLKQEVQDTKVETGLGNSTANSVEVPKAIQDTITNNSSVSAKTESAGDTKHTQILIKNPSGGEEGHSVWRQLPGAHTINQTAAVMIAEGLSYAPAEHVKFMADVLSATKNISGLGEELYSLPCTPTVGNKDLLLTFYLDESKTVVLRYEDLLMKNPADPSNCIFIFVENKEVNVGYEWALGGSFFNNHCAMLDYKNHKLGFTYVVPPVAA